MSDKNKFPEPMLFPVLVFLQSLLGVHDFKMFSRRLTFRTLLFPFHLLAVLLQLPVGQLVEGVWSGLTDNDTWMVLLFDDGFGGSHQLPL